MATMTLEQFGKGLAAAGVLTADELKGIWTSLPAEKRPRDAEGLAAVLKEKGKLTDYQAQIALQGKAQSLAFGNYVLMSQLGVGASGHVFRARHKTSGREVAIKVLAAAIAKDEKSVKRFHREVEATAKLTHPNIVRAIDAGELRGQHYMVMEFVEGRDLSSIVKKDGPLEIELAVKCVLQAARGLEYAHSQSLIHRDIKPGNLLLDKGQSVRILDMGLVRVEDSGEATADHLTGTQQVMGTIDYMAPEQVADTRHADARCDVYSLGCTLWFLLTGRKLYEGKGVVDRIMAHRAAEIPSLEKSRNGVTARLEAIFRKMVAKQADERYQSMSDVCGALERYLSGEETDEADDDTALLTGGSKAVGAKAVGLKSDDKIGAPKAEEAVAAQGLDFGGIQVAAGDAPAGGFAVSAAPRSTAAAKRPKAKGTKKPLDKRVVIGGGAAVGVLLVVSILWYFLAS